MAQIENCASRGVWRISKHHRPRLTCSHRTTTWVGWCVCVCLWVCWEMENGLLANHKVMRFWKRLRWVVLRVWFCIIRSECPNRPSGRHRDRNGNWGKVLFQIWWFLVILTLHVFFFIWMIWKSLENRLCCRSPSKKGINLIEKSPKDEKPHIFRSNSLTLYGICNFRYHP